MSLLFHIIHLRTHITLIVPIAGHNVAVPSMTGTSDHDILIIIGVSTVLLYIRILGIVTAQIELIRHLTVEPICGHLIITDHFKIIWI